jgi:Ni,Fe-hydrogenase I cytochrome b subunit
MGTVLLIVLAIALIWIFAKNSYNRQQFLDSIDKTNKKSKK